VKNEQTDYLELPDHLQDRDGDNHPELLRFDPKRRYVKGNVVVVSRRAAIFIEFIRNVSAKPVELRHFAKYIEDGTIMF
jgi:hypothetical protein